MNGMKIILLIFIIFLTIIVSILISIIVIIKYRNKDIGIQISALILISVASQCIRKCSVFNNVLSRISRQILDNFQWNFNDYNRITDL